MRYKLSRKSAHRDSLVRNLLSSLILYESIKTTCKKAVLAKSEFDILINNTKSKNLQSIRYASSKLFDINSRKKLFEQIIPRYEGITSGYCKIYKLGRRQGDNATMAILELKKKKEYRNLSNMKIKSTSVKSSA